MEPSFITLKRSDKDFQSYLEGTFSKTLRALPIESVNVNSDAERVTFRLVPVHEIQRPKSWFWWLSVLRPQWSTLALSPLLATWAYLYSQGHILDGVACGFAFLSVLLFQIAVFLFNDYSDYIQGVDRMRPKDERDIIKKGWITAHRVHQLAFTALIFAMVSGAPLILRQPYFLVLAGLAAVVAVVGYSFRHFGWKYWGLGEATVFLCLGPVVTYGASRVAVEEHPWEIYLLGIMFGHLAMICLQARQWSTLMQDQQAKAKTLAARLGFDRTKSLLLLQLAVNAFLVGSTWVLLGAPLWSVLFLIPYAFEVGRIFNHIQQTQSPLSSVLGRLHWQTARLHLFLGLAFISAFVF